MEAIWMKKYLITLMLIAPLFGCGSGSRYSDYNDYENSAISNEEKSTYTDADASDVNPEDVEQPDFNGCIHDCSGHEAGFEWARNNDVTDEIECGSRSQSFHDGCVQFVDERQEQANIEVQQEAEQAAVDAQAAEYESENY